MNYVNLYNQLCSKSYNTDYTENHHIIPRCLGGSDEKDNIIRLSPKAHYLAHRLLCKIYPDDIKLKFAFNMMSRSNSKQERNLTSEQYSNIKIENSLALSILHSTRVRSEEEKSNISKALKGKPKSDEHKQKCSDWQKGKPKPWQIGRKHSEETRSKISEKRKGAKHTKPSYERTDEHKEKVRAMNLKRSEPSFNTKGYEILTPTGFQKFDGVAYSGLVHTLEFKTKDYCITVSNKHRFDNSDKIAKDYKVGDSIITELGEQEIISITPNGKKQVYDILDVKNGNLYLANGIQNHNCEIIRDETKTVIPEFDDELVAQIVREYPKPPHYTPYVAMDLGFKDFTVVLFGYYDFKQDKIVIEDEIAVRGDKLKLNTFTTDIIAKEEQLWLNILTNEQIKPACRVSDVDYMVINEINRQSGGRLNFQPVKKEPGYKLPLINQMRIQLQSGKIIINPRCETLIRHLRNARWKDASAKDDFARSPDNGHYDAVDSLLYLIKSVAYNKNPYPNNYDSNQDTFHNNGAFGYNNTKNNKTPVEIYQSIFGIKKKRN